MKKIKIRDKLFIFMLFVFILLSLSTLFALEGYKDNQKLLIEDHKSMIKWCNNINKNEASDEEIKFCTEILTSDLSEYDLNAYEAYEFYIVDYFRNYLSEFIIIAIVITGSAYYVTKYLRNRIILNEINRKSYKSIIRKLFFSAWKYALLIPIMLIVIFFIVYFFVGINGFNLGLSGFSGTMFENNLLLYFIVVIIQSFVLSMIHINITLLISRKEHNYILSIIKSYILVIGLEIFFEIIISPLIYRCFNSGSGIYFNILNIYNYSLIDDNLNNLFVLIGLLLISFIPLFLGYKNKEKLIIASEKNDNKEEV